jgi:hypothetical protein
LYKARDNTDRSVSQATLLKLIIEAEVLKKWQEIEKLVDNLGK